MRSQLHSIEMYFEYMFTPQNKVYFNCLFQHLIQLVSQNNIYKAYGKA
jgi:hypothetical protein